MMSDTGAYVLHLSLNRPVTVRVPALGEHTLAPGWYIYVGSARRGIAARSARHERLARTKRGKLRWHIDFILTHPNFVLERTEAFPGVEECELSRRIASQSGITVPIRRFGSTDCRSGCPAHLYHSAVPPQTGDADASIGDWWIWFHRTVCCDGA